MLRLGIIGCGRVTTMFHLKAIDAVDQVVVAGVADTSEARMGEVRRMAQAEKGCTDYRELLRDPGVDAVAINTPPRFHEQMVVDSLSAGKHVLCEKPLAQTVEGCQRIREAQGMTGLVVLPGHNYAFTPSLLRMEELIAEGAVGELRKVLVRFENNLKSYGSRTSFRLMEDYGIVEDILPHILSVSTPLAGRADSVGEVSGRCKRYEVCDNMTLTLGTEGGVEVECSLSWTRLIPRFRVEVLGSRGRMFSDLMMSPYTVTIEAAGERKRFKDRGLGWYLDLVQFKHPSFQSQYRHLVALVAGRGEPRISIDDEVAMLRMIDLVTERAKEGGVVER